MIEFTVKAAWDPVAFVWWVSETDVPGLATEAPTIEALLKKLSIMIPELLEANNELPPIGGIVSSP